MTHLDFLHTSPHATSLAFTMCTACPAVHLPAPPPYYNGSQDHSGTLGAEEFKACLISLGFDIANDAQVLAIAPPSGLLI